MDNIGRMFSQVAAEAKVSSRKAKAAVYLMGLATTGRTLDEAATAVRRKPDFVKRYAREFMIDFVDYRPFAQVEAKGAQRPEPRVLLETGALA